MEINRNPVAIKIPVRENTVITTPRTKIVTIGYESIPGATGDSAYRIAVRNGYEGTEKQWVKSLKGDPFVYEDFTPEQLDALVAKQPPMNPSPVDVFNLAYEG